MYAYMCISPCMKTPMPSMTWARVSPYLHMYMHEMYMYIPICMHTYTCMRPCMQTPASGSRLSPGTLAPTPAAPAPTLTRVPSARINKREQETRQKQREREQKGRQSVLGKEGRPRVCVRKGGQAGGHTQTHTDLCQTPVGRNKASPARSVIVSCSPKRTHSIVREHIL